MSKISKMDNILETKVSRITVPAMNAHGRFMNFYVNRLHAKCNLDKKPLFIEYIVYVFCLLNTVKYIICFVSNTETRKILYDPSLFMGGVPQYNRFVLILMSLFGVILFKNLHLYPSKRLVSTIHLLDIIRGKKQPDSLIEKQNIDIRDIVFMTKICYNVFINSYIFFCKYA